MNIVAPLSVAWEKVQWEKILLIDRALLTLVTHKFWGEFWGCILWTPKKKTKLNTETF